ncbi:hypothetical protein AeNC1_012183 [Aphanomyces euteiches]|nr:hypothetical protein AeNC1_012183 [Aphanomyces euteiches]
MLTASFFQTQEPIPGRTLVIDCCQQTRIFQDGAFRFITTDEEFLQYQDNKDVIRLIDGRSDRLFSWTGVSILFSSTDYCDYKSFLKSTNVQYIMPPWTEKELCIAAPVAGITTKEAQDRLQVFGGIARFVFSTAWDDYFINATDAFSIVRWLEIFHEVRLKEVNEKKYPHRLLHLFPQHARSRAYCGSYVTFGSNYIAEKVYDTVMKDSMDEVTAFMAKYAKDTTLSSFRAKLFEIFCHRLWSSAGEHRLVGKILQGDSQAASQEGEYSISIPAEVEVQSFSNLSEIPVFTEAKAMYFRRNQPKFAGIDAIFWNGHVCYLLQMSISKDPGIAHEALVEIHKWATDLGIHFEYVFMVPMGQVQDYKVQNFVTTTRRVHEMPSNIALSLVQHAVGVEMPPKKTV